MKWVSVKRRLPENGKDVLVLVNGRPTVAEYRGTYWREVSRRDPRRGQLPIPLDWVTHWTEIEPPEEKNDR